MKWVTRRTIRVNRAATAWLIRRFLDPQAVFLFVEPEQVALVEREQDAIGFDAPGAKYPHKDAQGRCSFEALVAERCAADPALARLARIVHGADFSGVTDPAPEAEGLREISMGFPLVTRDDHETVERAGFLYDSLYAAIRERIDAAGGRDGHA